MPMLKLKTMLRFYLQFLGKTRALLPKTKPDSRCGRFVTRSSIDADSGISCATDLSFFFGIFFNSLLFSPMFRPQSQERFQFKGEHVFT
jgi:hypothetical protein